MDSTRVLLVIDGSNLVLRMFFGMPNLATSTGIPTGAIKGCIDALRRMLRITEATHWLVAWDSSRESGWRRALFADYKATRKEQRPEMTAQWPYVKRLFEALSVPGIIQDGEEADDVIAAAAIRWSALGGSVVIASSDKDLAQLVAYDNVRTFTEDVGFVDRDAVQAKYGVPPELLGDVLAIAGDTSDNIPGVRGVGMKTAAKWVLESGGLENLLRDSSALKGVRGDAFRESADMLPVYRQLVHLDAHVGTPPDLEAYTRRRAPHYDSLLELYSELEFVEEAERIERLRSAARFNNRPAGRDTGEI